jgi:DNA-binding transcriptional LysR family regulator
MAALGQIEAFVAVARHENVSRAADELFLTQPALTARLQRLERELDASLFVRTARGMQLSEAGHAFLPYAVRALETLADGRRQVDALERGGAGRLALGAAPGISTYVLPTVLKEFAESHPRVAVSVKTGHSEEVLALLLADQVDIGLVRRLRHPDIESMPLYEDRLVLVVEPQHPFATAKRIAMDAVGHEQLILFDRTSSYYELTSALFRQAGVVPVGVMELDNIEAAKKMVQQGFGVALLPAHVGCDRSPRRDARGDRHRGCTSGAQGDRRYSPARSGHARGCARVVPRGARSPATGVC